MAKDKILIKKEISIEQLNTNYLNLINRIKVFTGRVKEFEREKKEIEQTAKDNNLTLPQE